MHEQKNHHHQEPSQLQNRSQISVTNIERKQQKLLRIYADDYSTKHLVIFWVIFFMIIIITSLLTLALPPTFVGFDNEEMTLGTALEGCSNAIGFDNQNYVYCEETTVNAPVNPVAGLLANQLSTRNQFLVIYLNFYLDNIAQSFVDIDGKMQIIQHKLIPQQSSNGLKFKDGGLIQVQQEQFQLKSFESKRIYAANGVGLAGYRKLFGYQKYIDEQNYLLNFVFKQWPLENIRKVTVDAIMINEEFTVFSILIRYLYFALSLGTTIVFYLKYRIIPQSLRTIEQKLVMYLSIFTVTFNDPLYAVTILQPNGFTAFTSTAFVVDFLTFMVALWMVFIDRILYESGQKFQNVLTKKKYAYFLALYLSFFILQFMAALHRVDVRPIVPGSQLSTGSFLFFEVTSVILFLAGIAYIVMQYVRACMDFMDKIWRYQIFLMFSVFFVIMVLILLLSNGFAVYDYVGNRILILFTFMNMFTIYMQYMYTITGPQAQKLQKDYLLGGNRHQRNNEVATIVSNFGQDDVIVDLDSEDGYEQGSFHYNGQNPYRKNKVQQNMNRLDSVQNVQQIEDDTTHNLQEGHNNKDYNKQSNFDIE